MRKISFLFAPLLLILVLFGNSIAQTKGTDPMVLEFNTNLSSGTTIKLPLTGSSLTIDWGDGNIRTITSVNTLTKHTYAIDGIYMLAVTP